MKYNIFICAAVTALLFSSCNKVEQKNDAVSENGVVYISLEHTKSLLDGADSQLSYVDIFVFDKSGLLRTSERVLGSSSKPVPISVPVGSGSFNVYAIANSIATSFDGVAKETDLLNVEAQLREDCIGEDEGEEFIEMMGKIENVKFVSGETYPISLKRTLSKIRLEDIEINLPAGYVGWRANIKDIYLINANIRTDYSLKWDNPLFVNKAGQDDSGESVSKYLLYGGTGQIENGETVELEDCNLYCYPNPTTTDSQASEWCPRFTRLVVEVDFEKMRYYYEEGTIVGEDVVETHKYYYPINIIGSDGKMNPNTSYNITKLTITGPGSDSPDVPIVKGTVSVSMTVADWSEGFKQAVEY